MLPDSSELMDKRDIVLGELFCWPNPGEKEKVRRVDGASAREYVSIILTDT